MKSPDAPLGRIVLTDAQLQAALGGVLRRFGCRLLQGTIEIEKLAASARMAGPI